MTLKEEYTGFTTKGFFPPYKLLKTLQPACVGFRARVRTRLLAETPSAAPSSTFCSEKIRQHRWTKAFQRDSEMRSFTSVNGELKLRFQQPFLENRGREWLEILEIHNVASDHSHVEQYQTGILNQ